MAFFDLNADLTHLLFFPLLKYSPRKEEKNRAEQEKTRKEREEVPLDRRVFNGTGLARGEKKRRERKRDVSKRFPSSTPTLSNTVNNYVGLAVHWRRAFHGLGSKAEGARRMKKSIKSYPARNPRDHYVSTSASLVKESERERPGRKGFVPSR
ncbi:hypothetical protein IE53DRAFT_40331 [Violaceomyces palustris]|uniref:Uncharacterized protein n=1 Tax=Violaceomyces palustris TaxID=1673888 RepID=A0ACD0P0Z5_9BASI|nr:hypothetical protein IE53DRAFT_40331 [Violaceomyces palustris]